MQDEVAAQEELAAALQLAGCCAAAHAAAARAAAACVELRRGGPELKMPSSALRRREALEAKQALVKGEAECG